MPRKTVSSRADRVEKRYGKTIKGNGGGARRSKASTKVRPWKTNPLKGKVGVKITHKF